jgi:hypothetical protein
MNFWWPILIEPNGNFIPVCAAGSKPVRALTRAVGFRRCIGLLFRDEPRRDQLWQEVSQCAEMKETAWNVRLGREANLRATFQEGLDELEQFRNLCGPDHGRGGIGFVSESG